jgi:hypothetical protein
MPEIIAWFLTLPIHKECRGDRLLRSLRHHLQTQERTFQLSCWLEGEDSCQGVDLHLSRKQKQK